MLMARRIGRPGLLGTMARTAVVAGTATATSNAVSAHQQRRAQDQARLAAYDAEQSAPAGEDEGGLGDQLAKLADLHSQGVLSDAEFAAAKQRLLA